MSNALGIDADTPTPAQGADTLTRRQVADACRVSLRTVGRWLDADELEGAHQDTTGTWRIPRTSILGRLPTGAPGEPLPAPGRLPAMGSPENADELELLRHEVTELRRRAEVAEAIARERGDALEDARLALRALAGTPSAPAAPTPTPNPANTPRRRRWSR